MTDGGDRTGRRLLSASYSIDLSALAKPPDLHEPKPQTIKLDLVEYYPSTRGDDIKHKADAEYVGVVELPSDGPTVVRFAGRSRAHNVRPEQIYAITKDGVRRILQTPHGRWQIRVQEIVGMVEGRMEDWAAPYFDPTSPKYYRSQPDYEDQTDADGERKYRRRVIGEVATPRGKTASQPGPGATGCAVFLCLGLVAFALGGCALLLG